MRMITVAQVQFSHAAFAIVVERSVESSETVTEKKTKRKMCWRRAAIMQMTVISAHCVCKCRIVAPVL